MYFDLYGANIKNAKGYSPSSQYLSVEYSYVRFEVFLRNVRRLLVTVNISSSPILVTLITEAICYFRTSVLTTATRHNIPEDGILHSHGRDNLKSYIALTDWTL
jgi:hypothetical protein